MSVDHYENFPVASWLCPPSIRPAIRAIYRFARTADDLADEGDAAPADRLAALADFRAGLDRAARSDGRLAAGAPDPADGRPGAGAPEPADGRPAAGVPGAGLRWPAVFEPLAAAMAAHALPLAPFQDLLSAFEQDVRAPDYADRAALLDYCARSAHPVGRLLLHLYRIDDARSLAQSDDICGALQLANFWQDLSVDVPRGRHYLPLADLERHGVTRADLAGGRDTPASRALVADLVGWTRARMQRGAPLARRVPGRAGWELRLVVQGGLAVLDKIERAGFGVLGHRPTLAALDVPRLAWRALRSSPG